MAEIPYWYWLALGGILGIVEIILPGFVLIWLGLSAALVGLIAWLWPTLPIAFEIGLFALLSVISAALWLRVAGRAPPPSDSPHLNRRAEGFIGRQALVVEPVVRGRGRVQVADSTWSAAGPDLPAGAEVRITGVDGMTLVIEPIGDRPNS